jgi:hypothetical protein
LQSRYWIGDDLPAMSEDTHDLPDQSSSEKSDCPDSFERPDAMAPPPTPCECYCLHCGRVFMSDQMWLQRVIGARDGFEGFWMCPTPNCGGAGFTFDIFPTDPDHPANEGWVDLDDEEIPYDDDEEWQPEPAASQPLAEYDPAEPHYQSLDEHCDDEDDIEGEEWKYGLEPGQTSPAEPPPEGCEPQNWAEQEALYNAPDRRPRELDWTHREDDPASGGFSADDIPL